MINDEDNLSSNYIFRHTPFGNTTCEFSDDPRWRNRLSDLSYVAIYDLACADHNDLFIQQSNTRGHTNSA